MGPSVFICGSNTNSSQFGVTLTLHCSFILIQLVQILKIGLKGGTKIKSGSKVVFFIICLGVAFHCLFSVVLKLKLCKNGRHFMDS
jgi:hypothetical protein